MKVCDQLSKRLFHDFGFEVVSIERIYRGRNGKAAGTFAWMARLADGSEVGSEDTVNECVRASKLSLFKSQVHSLSLQVCVN